MMPPLFFYHLVLLGLLWVFCMLPYAWPSRYPAGEQRPATPLQPRSKRSREPKPFAGLTHKPLCVLCEQDLAHPKAPPPVPPEPMPPTNLRPRQVDTSKHFCPQLH
jgi:hypothetical protein